VAKGSLRFRFDAICGPEQSPMIRAQWIEAMHRFGITIIEGVPEQVDAGRTFAKAAGVCLLYPVCTVNMVRYPSEVKLMRLT